MLNKKRIISIFVSYGSFDEFLDVIAEISKKHISDYICVSGVHMLFEAWKSPEFKNIVNSAIISTPDGWPVAKSFKVFYGIEQERVAGMDLFPALLRKAEEENLSVFFYGSTEDVLIKIVERAKREFPDLKIAGFYSPPFRKLTKDEEEEIIELINSKSPDIVFVSLGCPKQERWMYKMRGRINSLMIGVGGAFPVYAELVKRAPLWMRKFGLEWFYRLLQEPKRLFKRYLISNTIFVLLFFKELVKKIVRGEKYE